MHKLKDGPQSRAPLKWGEGAKNHTARRHQGCPTNMPEMKERKRVEGEGREANWKIGTWNVRNMNERGKLENVKQEMKKHGLNVLGLSEVRWKGTGELQSDEVKVFYSGGEERQRGVAVMMDNETAKSVLEIQYCSDRLMMVKIKAEPVNVIIIQVYMPTSDHEDDEIEEMYDRIEELMDKLKGTESVIVMGDWNGVVGEGRESREVGPFGLGKRNDRGQKLVEFCKRRKMIVSNTWFDQPKRRRYTWKAPGETGRYQLDYLLVKQRYRNSVKSCKSYPGADCDSDHNLVMAKMRVTLKKIQRHSRQKKWEMENLKKKAGEFREYLEGKVICGVGEEINDRWRNLKDAVRDAAKEVIGYQKRNKAKKPWVTTEMLDKMEERRRFKNSKTEDGKKNYKRLNNELRRETEKAREIWWEKECKELEELNRQGRTDAMHRKVKELTDKKKSHGNSTAIKDKNGEMLVDEEGVRARWREYVEDLYDNKGKPKEEDMEIEDAEDVDVNNKGPEIIREEIWKAVQQIKENKAVGIDEIPAEFWKILGERGMEELVGLCQEMYEKGRWPEDFTRLVLIPIPKKENAVECGDYRTISLICHASKIMLKVLTKRLESKAESFLSNRQFGFRKGVGTRDAIAVMRMICERGLEYGKDIYICFVDFEKAFDRVRWDTMMQILKDLQVDWKDRRLIKDLYMRQEAVVRLTSGETEPAGIGRGVRQGCPLSPLLFSIYAESMMKEALDKIEEGVKIGGRLVKDVRFADDQGMVADTNAGLQRLMNGLQEEADRYGMKVNVKKTKTMVISREESKEVKIELEGNMVEQVRRFKYLGSIMSDDGRCLDEIKCRIAMAKEAFAKRKELLCRKISLTLRKRLVKSLVWPVLLYGCETWTMRKEERKRLLAFEMWTWRKLAKVNWSDRKTNVEVLEMVGEERILIETIMRRKKNWMGHVLRGEGLLLEVTEGRFEGKRGKGRPRVKMLDDMIEDSYASMKRKAQNRARWRNWMPRTCREAEHE